MNFAEHVNLLANYYVRDEKLVSLPSTGCAHCEFKATDQEREAGLKSGFHECWKERLSWTDEDFKDSTMFGIWNFRKKGQCLNEGRIKLSDICQEDISPTEDENLGISSSARQWLQVTKAQSHDATHWIDSENLYSEMSAWVYPLHFIDLKPPWLRFLSIKGDVPMKELPFSFPTM